MNLLMCVGKGKTPSKSLMTKVGLEECPGPGDDDGDRPYFFFGRHKKLRFYTAEVTSEQLVALDKAGMQGFNFLARVFSPDGATGRRYERDHERRVIIAFKGTIRKCGCSLEWRPMVDIEESGGVSRSDRQNGSETARLIKAWQIEEE